MWTNLVGARSRPRASDRRAAAARRTTRVASRGRYYSLGNRRTVSPGRTDTHAHRLYRRTESHSTRAHAVTEPKILIVTSIRESCDDTTDRHSLPIRLRSALSNQYTTAAVRCIPEERVSTARGNFKCSVIFSTFSPVVLNATPRPRHLLFIVHIFVFRIP